MYGRYRFGAFLMLSLVAVLLAGVCPRSLAADEKAATVSVTVDYGDGVEKRFTALPWKAEQTVLDALAAAQTHPHGVKVTLVGKGPNAMVTQIDDLKNEGGGAKNRNWLFFLNGKMATRGAGSVVLTAGDAVLWKFTVYEYNDAK